MPTDDKVGGGDAGEQGLKPSRREVPTPVVQRLPVYYRFLDELIEDGVQRISSAELGKRVGVTASQLRQDLSYFGSFGQQGYGYRVDDLHRALERILRLNRRHELVLVGAGNLGRALARYEGFRERGFYIVAVFDADAGVIGTRVGVLEVQPVLHLDEYLRTHQVDIGVLAVPASAAQQLAEMFVRNGVKGLWSFAPTRLVVPSDVIVEHQHLSDSLMSLSFRMCAD